MGNNGDGDSGAVYATDEVAEQGPGMAVDPTDGDAAATTLGRNDASEVKQASSAQTLRS